MAELAVAERERDQAEAYQQVTEIGRDNDKTQASCKSVVEMAVWIKESESMGQALVAIADVAGVAFNTEDMPHILTELAARL